MDMNLETSKSDIDVHTGDLFSKLEFQVRQVLCVVIFLITDIIVVMTTIIRIFAVISSHGRELISVKDSPCIFVGVKSRVATMPLEKEWSGRMLRLSHTSRGVRTVKLTLVDGMKECVFSIDVRMLRAREFVQEGLEIYEGGKSKQCIFLVPHLLGHLPLLRFQHC
jgi:hypothetical protein